MTRSEPAFAESVCLAVVAEAPTHGWAVGTLLAADGEIGRIWTLSRPLTYRAIDVLIERRLLRRPTTTTTAGRARAILRPTAAGQRLNAAWLDRPVDHPRDVRTELLVKLTLRRRAGLTLRPLLEAQQRQLGPAIEALTMEVDPGDLVALWRSESAQAVQRFLDQAIRRA